MATTEMTATYATLSARVYADSNVPTDGWNKLNIPKNSDDSNGFYAEAYEKDGKIIIAYRGSDDRKDWLYSDAQIAAGNLPDQWENAKAFYKEVERRNPNTPISVTGHSLGGALAQFVAAVYDLNAETFAAPGVLDNCRRLEGFDTSANYDKVINHILVTDPFGNYGRHVGQTNRCLPGSDVFSSFTLFSAFHMFFNMFDQSHSMDTYHKIFTTAAAARRVDPLILDLDGDGVETTNVKDGAYFDHDSNGFAEQTGWAGSDDGLLVMDRNNNGTIDNGSELFGDQTILQNGQRATDGFQALAELDSNSDGVIDVNDTAFSNLRIWQDIDGDGYSASDELFTLQEMGISSINVAHTDTNTTDPQGNTQIQAGTFTKTDGIKNPWDVGRPLRWDVGRERRSAEFFCAVTV